MNEALQFVGQMMQCYHIGFLRIQLDAEILLLPNGYRAQAELSPNRPTALSSSGLKR